MAKIKKPKFHEFRKTLKILKINGVSFLRFEMIYKLFTYLLFLPLMKKLEAFTLYLNGVSSMTNYNFAKVLQNPLTWIMFLLILVLNGVCVAIELCGLANGIHASSDGIKVTAREMINDGIADAMRIFIPKNWMFVVYVLLVMPLSDIFEFSTVSSQFAIPGFIMETINDIPALTVCYWLAIALLVWLTMKWIYIIPDMAICGTGFKEASKKSSRMAKKQMVSMFLALIRWTLLAGAVMLGMVTVFAVIIYYGTLWLEPATSLSGLSSTAVSVSEIISAVLFALASAPTLFTRIHVGYQRSCMQMNQTLPTYKKQDNFLYRHLWCRITAACLLVTCIYTLFP